MQLDADEDGEPFFRPPIIAPSPLPPLNQQQQSQQQQEEESQSRNPTIVEPGGEIERPQASAATATLEQEE